MQTEHSETEQEVVEEESGSEESETDEDEDPDEDLAKKHPLFKKAVKILEDLKVKFP